MRRRQLCGGGVRCSGGGGGRLRGPIQREREGRRDDAGGDGESEQLLAAQERGEIKISGRLREQLQTAVESAKRIGSR